MSEESDITEFDFERIRTEVCHSLTQHVREMAASVDLVTTDSVGGYLRWNILYNGKVVASYAGNNEAEAERVRDAVWSAMRDQDMSVVSSELTLDPVIEFMYQHMTTSCASPEPEPANESEEKT